MKQNSEENYKKAQEMFSLANRYRGIFIGSFVQIEFILADIIISIDYNNKAGEYYKKYKMAAEIHKDFWKSFNKIKTKIDGFINDEELLKSDLETLINHRNIFAHWLLLIEDTYIENFNNDTVWLYSWKLGKDHLTSYSKQDLQNLELKIRENMFTLSLLQKSVYKFLEKPIQT